MSQSPSTLEIQELRQEKTPIVENLASPLDPYADWTTGRNDSNYTTPPSGIVDTSTPASSPTGFSQVSEHSGYEYPNASNDIIFDASVFEQDEFQESSRNTAILN